MTDIGSSQSRVGTRSDAYSSEPEPTGWTGWIAFAALMMIMVGSFQMIQGFVALLDEGYYAVSKNGLVIHADYTTWGWFHLLVGVVLLVSGIGILAGNTAARVVGVVIAAVSALANVLFIAAYPWWSLTIITIDILVIYALIVHGRELRDPAK